MVWIWKPKNQEHCFQRAGEDGPPSLGRENKVTFFWLLCPPKGEGDFFYLIHWFKCEPLPETPSQSPRNNVLTAMWASLSQSNRYIKLTIMPHICPNPPNPCDTQKQPQINIWFSSWVEAASFREIYWSSSLNMEAEEQPQTQLPASFPWAKTQEHGPWTDLSNQRWHSCLPL